MRNVRTGLARWGVLFGGVLGQLGCGSGELSVSLIFPNEVTRNVVRALTVEAYRPNTGGAASSNQDCQDFLGDAAVGDVPPGMPVRAEFTCDDSVQDCGPGWFAERELIDVLSGQSIIYVLAYASVEDGAPPILEGCSDQFDTDGGSDASQDVPISMQIVLPRSARLVAVAGNRQVAEPGTELPVPLTVKVEANPPAQPGMVFYPIPGVPVRFESETTGLTLLDGGSGTQFEGVTGEDGLLSVRVRLPDSQEPNGTVRARAEALVAANSDLVEAEFRLSTAPPIELFPGDVEQLDTGRAVQVALASLDNNSALDLVVLSCEGTEERCTAEPDRLVEPPFGITRMTVIGDFSTPGAQTWPVVPPDNQTLGILPADMVVVDLDQASADEIAVLNGRRQSCQGRSCESSEILVFRQAGNQIVPYASRYILTASNAVSLTTAQVSLSRDIDYTALTAASQGRSVHDRPCTTSERCPQADLNAPICSDLTLCGCPPQERCTELRLPSGLESRCVAQDKIVDLLTPVSNTLPLPANVTLFNRNGCQNPSVVCDNLNPQTSTCDCGAPNLGNSCSSFDGCGCRVPDRIHIGAFDSTVLPFDISAGAHTAGTGRSFDLIVGSLSGLELIEALTTEGAYEWKEEPIVNAPIHAVISANIDPVAEFEQAPLDPQVVDDVVWYAQQECLAGSNFERTCPYALDSDERMGCFGVFLSDGESSLFNVRPPTTGGCRRHHLPFVPAGMCVADINGDGNLDVALSSLTDSNVHVYTGDGRGGLLDPPQSFALPGGGMGGPMVCRDLDGDAKADVVVAATEDSTVHVLTTQP